MKKLPNLAKISNFIFINHLHVVFGGYGENPVMVMVVMSMKMIAVLMIVVMEIVVMMTV